MLTLCNVSFIQLNRQIVVFFTPDFLKFSEFTTVVRHYYFALSETFNGSQSTLLKIVKQSPNFQTEMNT